MEKRDWFWSGTHLMEDRGDHSVTVLRCDRNPDPASAGKIAAAPDMLAALKKLVPADIAERPGDFAQDWHEAAAAIAKAET